MTLLKDNNYKDINVALLSLEADIKNKITGFDTSEIDKQLAEINSRIDKINAGGGSNSSDEIEDINSKLNSNSIKIRNIEQNIEDIDTQINGIEQKLSDIFSAENKVTDFNTTTNSGIYYWKADSIYRPSAGYGVLLVNKYDDGSGSAWINQIAYGTNNKIYFRQNINSTDWTEWKAVAFEGQMNATLTVNGKTYNGSQDVDAGVQTVANGGTGATTAKDAFMSLANGLSEGTGPLDTEYMVYKNPDGSNWGLYKLSHFWEYIKSKISSVLGLTKDNYGGKASTAGTADKTVNDIDISIPWTAESGQYVIPFGNILEPTSTATESPYNWDITGFFSIIRPAGHNGSHIQFEAGHGYSHDWTTYAYLDKFDFRNVTTSIKAFQYNGKWWLGLCITTSNQGYGSKMTITYSRGLPATPTCILYYSRSNGVVNGEINNSIQDIPSSWWRRRTIYNPTTFTQDIISPSIKANSRMVIPIGAPSSLEDGCIWIS